MKKITLLLFLSAIISFGQKKGDPTNTSKLRTISGYVTDDEGILVNANVLVLGSNRGTFTDKEGFFRIKARNGETIRFSYIGLNPVEVLVDKSTNLLNIILTVETSTLDELPSKQKEVN